MLVRRLVPVLAAGLAASALAVLTPAVAVAAPQSRPPSQAASPSGLAWQRCGADTPADFECTTVKVPLDYRAPGGKKIDVAVSRIRTADPAKRRGVLLFNPGGPGGPGLGMPPEFRDALPRSVLDRFDLVGFDPRGVGESTPLACGLSDEEKLWPRPYVPGAFAVDVARARGTADKCRAEHGADLKHFTTRNTARDMDAIRAALGEPKLSYVGYSYGTYLGAVYAQLFPQRADRIVLDSAVDPALAWRETFRHWGPDAEKAFERWTRWAAGRHAQYGLGATPRAVSKTFWDLVAQADRTPVTVGSRKVSGVEIRDEMRPSVYEVRHASELVAMLKEAAAGKPVPDVPADPPMSDNEASLQFAIVCGDVSWPKDPRTYRKDALRDGARFPLYGDFASHINPCAFWDRPAERVTVVDNRVPALIVQNEWDSQTPLATARGMQRAMKGARMVTVDEGEGHGVYLFGSACASDVTSEYLATGRLPAKDVTCRAEPGARRAAPVDLPKVGVLIGAGAAR
ncbi:alpha/beta hydrolase [Streptomyces sp. NPDC047315]|uniref:alpha/beta hydrolase n=1 Tax=Streptomyces sp. NPDC047315 TaxID=3155142 RepID=UPI00340A94C6